MAITQPSTKNNKVDTRFIQEQILPDVFKPARYIGIEQGAYNKPVEQAKVTFAMAFPDIYEIGISNYGVKLIYSLINQHSDYLCDRVYAPAPDMREKLREHDVPLYGIESFLPLKNFDFLAFTLQYELNYTTILGMLEAAHLPLRSADRTSMDYPIVIAGGPGSANPIPLSPFFDAFIIGDGEEILIEIMDLMAEAKASGMEKEPLLQALAEIPGMYVPSLFKDDDFRNKKIQPASKRIVDIAEHPVELAPLIPVIQAVHDRITIEARRGCDRMCRFCQPCFINLPVREQNIDNIKESALKEIEKTGYEECSLLSLSIADYSHFKPLIMEVAETLKEEGVSLSLPSQRADRFSIDVAEAVQSVRKSTLTFAPEAGTTRLRDVINKNLSDDEIMNAVTSAYKTGWNKVKLYFIIGLPTETLDDLDGILDTVDRLQKACKQIQRDGAQSNKKHLEVNVTLSNFVPKPHTPFQWFPQDTMEMLNAKRDYIRDQVRQRRLKGVKINFTDPEISKLEAVISKGGAELADVIELAYKTGAYLDAWDDIMNFDRWFKALEKCGINHEAYTRERCVDPADDLPWDVIDMGLDKEWLAQEYEKAKAAGATVPCFEACSTCGVCANYGTWPKFTDTEALEKREQARRKEREKAAQSDSPINHPGKSKKHSLKPVGKIRIKLEKRGPLKFISHLDWLRLIHRCVQRAQLPVAYSQGFSPKPKIAFSPALPLFTESKGEYIDIEVTEPIDDACSRLNAYLPEGGKALSETPIAIGSKSIDKSIRSLGYEAIYSGQTTCNGPGKEYTSVIGDTICQQVEYLSNQPELPIDVDQKRKNARQQQRKKTLNIAPYIASLQATRPEETGNNQPLRLTMRLKWQNNDPGAIRTIKPSWLLETIQQEARWSLIRTDIELV